MSLAGAESGADCEFALTRGGTDQEEAGEVGARDEKDESDGGEQDKEGLPGLAGIFILGGDEPGIPAPGFGVRLGDAGGDGLKFLGGLPGGDAGGEAAEDGEDRFMPASPKVATYDLAPEMSAAEVTDRLVAAIEAGHDLIVVNYANPDMVGHTGILAAAVRAVEAVDTGLGRALAALQAAGGAMLLTADHGNCETMVDPVTGGPHTAHTTNLVPVALVNWPEAVTLAPGRLADVAPTLLEMMGLPQPDEMTGRSLIRRG